MKRIVVLAALIVGLISLPTTAAHSMSGGGAFLVGNPGTSLCGVSECLGFLIFDCNPNFAGDGIDGKWWSIAGFGDGAHTLTITMSPGLDVDAYFFDSGCFLIDNFDCADGGGLGATESCTVPSGAVSMVVDAFLGSGSYSFTIA